jgi:signal transduction histidine kinase
VAAEDLTEILGALIENAARHARRRVRVLVGEEAGAPSLVIEDDGHGIGREAVEAVLVRGGRLDEAGPGHGLGLAIVHDLMQASGGTVALGRGSLGGLEVRLKWTAQNAI